MSRILAIDYGRKRVGIAVTDPLRIIANQLETVEAPRIIEWLKDYFAKNEVGTVVVGKPLKMDGTQSDSQQDIDKFIVKFRKAFPEMPLLFQDERFTSVLAKRAMIEAGVPKMKRQDKALVDRVSAVIILQSYMETL